ncbi:outer membrane autotransporter protein [Brevundimonas lenta]|uniref:Outer membrane autotransporter protein n=1 Tax=Brevundimonas lenta TaxID=424796 RepID=A0A7W6NRP1_9CAUL|nr:outer membrane autotransporter protein [Brevundimonas lenta]
MLLTNRTPVSGAWGRAFTRQIETTSIAATPNSSVHPSWDGDLTGVQAGADLWAGDVPGGGSWRVGLSVAHAEARGDVRGALVPAPQQPSGSLRVTSDSFGGYVTYIGHQGWYLDGVAVYGLHDLRLTSRTAQRLELEGESGALSLETGYPMRVSPGWVVEPQAQFIWQRSKIDRIDNPPSSVQFNSRDDLIGRLGVRFESHATAGTATILPFFSVDWIVPLDKESGILFNADSLTVHGGEELLNVSAGFDAQLTPMMSTYLTMDWGTDLDGDRYQSFGAMFGVRVVW